MEPANLIRWGGLAAVLAGVLLLVTDVLKLFVFENFSTTATTNTYVFITGGFLLSALLFSLGLVGLYASQAEAAGPLGLLGFLVAFIGTALVAGAFWAQEFFVPAAVEVAPDFLDNEQPGWLNFGFIMSFSLFALGWLLFGAATLRARVYPRWAAVLLMVGVVLILLPLPVPSLVFDVAVVWLGFVLLTRRSASTEWPQRYELRDTPRGS